MKVKFLRDHLDYKEKQVADVEDERGNYFVMVGVAEEYTAEKKTGSPVQSKKSSAGPNAKKKK